MRYQVVSVRSSVKRCILVTLLAGMGVSTLCASAQDVSRASTSISKSGASVDKRVNALLDQMTPDEKIGQLSQVFVLGHSASLEERIRAGQLGSVLFVTDPAQINSYQRLAVEGSRLHIPLLFGLDVIHGFPNHLPSSHWNGGIMGSVDRREGAGGCRG